MFGGHSGAVLSIEVSDVVLVFEPWGVNDSVSTSNECGYQWILLSSSLNANNGVHSAVHGKLCDGKSWCWD